MPAAAVAISLAWHAMGAPRYQSWFLGTQDGVLPVVHVARAGTELVIPALLALSAAVPVILLAQRPPSAAAIGAAAAVVIAAALAFGRASYRRAIDRAGRGVPLRVAAVSASPAAFDVYGGPPHVPGYSDVDATIGRYQPHIAAAIARGARLIVLPEYAVIVSAVNRQQWLAALSRWGPPGPRAGGQRRDRAGQEPAGDRRPDRGDRGDPRQAAPRTQPRTTTGERDAPALLPGTPLPLCAVQCVDLDYPDLIRPVSRAGGVLAVPVDDWKEITGMHHRSAVWSAVMAGVPVVRSAGHGISSVYDSVGRVVATADSLDGPVVLVADVRAAHPGKAASQTLSAAA